MISTSLKVTAAELKSFAFLIVLLGSCLSPAADVTLEGEDRDGDKHLDERELIEYLLKRNPDLYSYKYLSEEKGDTFEDKKKNAVKDLLWEMEEDTEGNEGGKGLGKPPPYTFREMRAWEYSQKQNVTVANALAQPEWKLDPGLVEEVEKKGIEKVFVEEIDNGDWRYGRPRIRAKVEDWAESNLMKVNGATASFTRDRLSNSDSWAGSGAFIYPLQFADDESQGVLLPSVVWNLQDVSNGSANDVQELTLGMPIQWRHDLGASSHFYQNVWRTYVSPFYMTDLDFDGAAVGVSLATEPHIQFKHPGLPEIGSLVKMNPNLPVYYQLRLIPKFEYADVRRTSRFIKRSMNDPFLGAGGDAELMLYPLGTGVPLQFTMGYSFLYDFESSDNLDIWSAKASWWFNDNLGLTGSFEDGDAPVSGQQIDQILIGLEVRY